MKYKIGDIVYRAAFNAKATIVDKTKKTYIMNYMTFTGTTFKGEHTMIEPRDMELVDREYVLSKESIFKNEMAEIIQGE